VILFYFIFKICFSSSYIFDESITVLGSYDDNIYYSSNNKDKDGNIFQERKSDFILSIDPSLYTAYKVNEIELGIKAGFNYNMYFSESKLSYLANSSKAIIKLNPDQRTSIELNKSYIEDRDPSFHIDNDPYKWIENGFLINTKYTSDSSFWSINASFENIKKNYLKHDYNHLDFDSYFFILENYFQFLPETAIILGIKTGFIDYSFLDTDYHTNIDSMHYELFTGIEGRLTNTVTLSLKLGYLWLDYQTSTDFHEPVISVEFKDLFSQVSSATAGYERRAFDSTYSNFYVDNKLFMSFKSILYDRLINLLTVQYIHRDYWKPNSRVDNRLGLISEFSYPLSTWFGRNISFIISGSYEWITSDVIDAYLEPDEIDSTIFYLRYLSNDPAGNYKRLFLSVGLTSKY